MRTSKAQPKCSVRLFALCLAVLLISPSPGAVAAENAEHGSQERKLDPRLAKFFEAKEKHAQSLVKELKLKVAPEVWPFFEAGKRGEWNTVASLYRELRRRSGQYTGTTSDAVVHTPVWQTVNEAFGAYEGFSKMDPKFIDSFGRGIIDSIPRGSIYFGGTDPGRWLITALSKSHPDADPFFTLTQNALADGTYLAYLRAMYGRRLAIPTDEEAKVAFEAYLAEAGSRLEKGELAPGENVSKDAKGNYSVSGTVSVFAINARIARVLFDKNSKHDFYLEQSHPLDWMYPHLTPHGLIFRIHREPLTQMSEAVLRVDSTFWQKETERWLGSWLKDTTPIKDLCQFAERVYGELDLEGFTGDNDFVLADRRYSPGAIYSRLRAAHAGVYAWRAKKSQDTAEKERMLRAAEQAYRQAFALGPWAHEAAFGYAELLEEQNRLSDAVSLLQAAARTNPGDRRLLQRAEEWQEKSERK